MKRLASCLRGLLHVPTWLLLILAPSSLAVLLWIFLTGRDGSALAYPVYAVSAYTVVLCALRLPSWILRIRAAVRGSRLARRLADSGVGRRYLSDEAFRAGVGVYRGLLASLLYAIFRLLTGIYYRSEWFFAIAIYYLVLGALRAYLAHAFLHREEREEWRCYRRAAWLLLFWSAPMGGIILLTVYRDAATIYPGHIIYISALYTFYILGVTVRGMLRDRRLGSPILSAAGILDLVASMMSVLGLQAAMLAQFSGSSTAFRQRMNAITGGVILAAVLATALLMLWRSRQHARGRENT